jgi:GDPmannose 4,6-dehydratase
VPTALITGVAGQDGAYLSALLRERGYRVVGMIQPGREAHPDLEPYLKGVEIVSGSLRDADSLRAVIDACDPDEVYNLAGVSSVARSWREPELTADVNGTGLLRLVHALIDHGDRVGQIPRLLQASSSEMFGRPRSSTQDESTPLHPLSPYALAKAFAHEAASMYRQSHGLFISSVILFNHESPLRPRTFVTRKISSTVAAIARGQADGLVLGDLEIRRDWGFAQDYVQAMWLALQADEAQDYVIATGLAHSIREWVATAFAVVGIDDWERLVSSDPALMRPNEPGALVGDAGRARRVLGWSPSTSFEDLVAEMVQHDLDLLGCGSAG